MTFLERVLVETRARLIREREALPLAALRERALETPAPPSLAAALRARRGSPAIIAEIKRRSPSAGDLARELRVGELARGYERAGASAISVLTEPLFFGGSLDDLEQARKVTALPLLRKDFMVDEYQLAQARACGASAVLLICAALEGDALADMRRAAAEMGLDALVEVHDERELERALLAEAELVGINNRDLTTLEVNLDTSRSLLPLLPEGVAGVSESGLRTRADVEEMGRLGASAVLVGTSLVGSGDPEAAARALAGDPR